MSRREQKIDLRVSLRGMGYVVLCIASLLLAMAILVVAVRFFAG